MSSYLKTIVVVSLVACVTTIAIKKAMKSTIGDKVVAKKLLQKGDASHKAKKWEEAISYYTMAIKLDAKNENSYVKRAESYLESKSYSEVKEDCNSAIRLNDKCEKAYFIRGKTHQLLGYAREANEDYKRAQELRRPDQMSTRCQRHWNTAYAANGSSTFTVGPVLIQNINIFVCIR